MCLWFSVEKSIYYIEIILLNTMASQIPFTFVWCDNLYLFKIDLLLTYIMCSPFKLLLTLSHIQQTCSRRPWRHLVKIMDISINEGMVTENRWKHCGKRRNSLFWAISPFVTMFSKDVCWRCVKMCLQVGKG